ncbi:SDR family oxidoreductase [Streptomyces sp. NPDC048483]|uniref:SDR family oxidoreductase n=1 Tax=Streptomyces sp. NPDC048483 TaxID=3154927 RepID=UPI0034458B02
MERVPPALQKVRAEEPAELRVDLGLRHQDTQVTLLSAITARTGIPGTAGLAALNGAVEALVGPPAAELAPIRVNAVSPGFVDTPWRSGLPDDARREYFAQAAATLPVRHIATAEEVAEVVALAATNANLTGTVVESDGGARLVPPAGPAEPRLRGPAPRPSACRTRTPAPGTAIASAPHPRPPRRHRGPVPVPGPLGLRTPPG